MAREITKQQFLSAYSSAPPAVRSAISSDSTTEAIGRLQTKYNLHIDTVGKIAEQVGYMLLGLLEPNAFYDNLLHNGVHPEAANAIIKDINDSIFLPLQARIRAGDTGADDEEEPEAEYDPLLDEVPAAPVQPEPRPQVPVMNVSAQPASPSQQPQAPSVTPAFNLIQPEAAVPVAPPVAPSHLVAPMMRTMQHDVDALTHGQRPDQYPVQTAPIPSIAQATPARSFQTASVPFTPANAAYQQAYVSQAPQPSLPPQQPAPQAVHPPAPVFPAQAMAASDSDPYREAI